MTKMRPSPSVEMPGQNMSWRVFVIVRCVTLPSAGSKIAVPVLPVLPP